MKTFTYLIALFATLAFLGACAGSPQVVVRDRGGSVEVDHADGSKVHIQMDSQEGRVARTAAPQSPPDKADERAKAIDRDIAAKQRELAELQSRATAQEAQSNATAKSRQESLERLEGRIAELRSTAEQLAGQIPPLTKQKQQLDAEVAGLRQQLEASASSKAELEKSLGLAKEQLDQQRRQIDEQQQQQRALTIKAAQTQKAADEAAATLKQHEEQDQRVRTEIFMLSTEAERLRDQNKQVTAEIQNLKAIQQNLSRPVKSDKALPGERPGDKEKTTRDAVAAAARLTHEAPVGDAAKAPAKVAAADRASVTPTPIASTHALSASGRLRSAWGYGAAALALVVGVVGVATRLGRPKLWEVQLKRPGIDGEPGDAEVVTVSGDEVVDLGTHRPRSVARETGGLAYLRINHFGGASLHAAEGARVRINGEAVESFPTAVSCGDRIEVDGADGVAATYYLTQIADGQTADDDDAVVAAQD